MANQFSVNPLGGLNMGAVADNVQDQWRRNELMDMQRQQFEQEQADREQQDEQQKKMRNLAMKAQNGDLMASQQLYAMNPTMGAKIDEAMGVRDEAQAQQVGGWLEKYLSTPAEQRSEFLQKTAGQTPFSVDDDLLEMDPAKRDQYASMLAGRYLNKEQIGMLQGGTANSTTSQQDFNYYQNLMKRDPEAGRQFGMAKGYIETGREAAPTTAQRDWKEYQRLKREGTPEEARQYGQAAGFVSKEGRELSAHMQKRLSQFTDEASQAGANVIKYNDLAEQFEADADDIGGGWFEAGWGEKIKEITGQEDWKTQLRKDAMQIKTSEAMKNLPPGPATDKDVELALKPFPADTANAQYISSYLRGLAKLSEWREKYNTFKANYVSEKGNERGMLSAWKEQAVKYEQPNRKNMWNGAKKVGRFEVKASEE